MNESAQSSPVAAKRLVSFVLPVYNEAANLPELYRKICAVMETVKDEYELVFVDDGSNDGSFEYLSELHLTDKRVKVIRLRRNFGKAAAYSAGFDSASGEIVVTLDTDLQDDPAEIPLFLEKIDAGFDMVSGWKHAGKGPLRKSLPSKFFNMVVRKITGIPLHDFNCPFKAYRREVLEEIEVYGELHRYIPVLASARGFTLTEIKISNLPRVHGKSNYGLERFIRGMLDLVTVLFITRFAKRPMHLLAMGGLITTLLGLGVLLFLVVAHFLSLAQILGKSWIIHDRPMLSLGILLMIVGIQFFSSGLLAELFVTGFSSSTDNKAYSVRKILDD